VKTQRLTPFGRMLSGLEKKLWKVLFNEFHSFHVIDLLLIMHSM